MFQQDNAPAHTSKLTKSWFIENAIETLPWPAQSPDLNPIENIWDYLERQIRSRKHLSGTLEQLGQAILDEWGKIPISLISNNQACRWNVEKDGGGCEVERNAY